jgi:Fic family protein
MMKYKVPLLPLFEDLESPKVLRKLVHAHRTLAELKGGTGIIPNQSILIDTLSLQEAKDSSEVENIITTHDEIFSSDVKNKLFMSPAAKEVHDYAIALRFTQDVQSRSSE